MRGNIFRKKATVMIFIVVAVLLVGGIGLYYFLNAGGGKASGAAQLNAAQQAQEDKKVLDQLKKIILLPGNINPTMAIITDAELLKRNQPGFFADSQNGERLIVYPDLAIIFDVEANKIIKVGGIQVATPVAASTTNSAAPTTSAPTKAKTTK